MPDSPTDTALLTQAQKQKLAEWLQQKSQGATSCSVCGHRSWTIADHLVTPNIFHQGGGLIVGGPSYPQALVICTNCGNTLYINAVLAGVVKGGAEPNA